MRMSWGLESPQTLLTLAPRLLRVFGAIVQVPVLAVFHAGQRLLCRRAIAPQLVGHDHPWHIHQVLEQLAEELLGSLCVTLTLHENIEDLPVLIDGPPKILTFALGGQKHSIRVPLVGRPGTERRSAFA
jgi:hypothetical protein